MSKENISRRDFLKLLIGGGLVIGAAELNRHLNTFVDESSAEMPPTGIPDLTQTPENLEDFSLEIGFEKEQEDANERANTTLPQIHEALGITEEGKVELDYPLGGLSNKKDFQLIWYKVGLTEEEKSEIFDRLRAGRQTAATVTEYYGNSVISTHSGYFDGKPLEFEFLREYLEGFQDETTQSNDYLKERLEKVLGTTLTLKSDTESLKFEVTGVARIPHELKLTDYNPEIKNIINAVTKKDLSGNYICTGNPGKFEEYKENKEATFFTFCGWGPSTASKNHSDPDYRYTYTQIVVALEQK